MQLIQYEFQKLFHRKIIFFLLFILLGLNLLLFHQNQKKVIFHNTLEYQTLLAECSSIPSKQAIQELNTRKADYHIISRILDNRSIGIAETVIQNDMQILLNDASKPITYKEFINKYSYYFEHEAKFNAMNSAVNTVVDQLATVMSYPEFIDSMGEKAKTMESASIFAKKDTFAYRNIQKTVQDFSDLKQLPLELGQEEGIIAVSDFTFTDYFLIAFILLLAIFLFVEERENGLLTLLKSTTYGRLNLAGSKFVVLLIATLFLSFFFYGSNFLLAKKQFGFGNNGRFIQSMAGFRDADIPLTVSQYLILLFLIKVLTLILIAAIASLLFTVITNTRLSFILLGGLLACSYMSYTFIYPTSYLNPLKYWNLFSFLDSYQILAYYNNLNLFGYPVSRFSSSLVIIIMFIILCLFTYLLFFRIAPSKCNSLNLVLLKRKGFSYLSKGSVHLWNHEVVKLLFSNKGVLLLLLALLLGLKNLDQSELYYNSEQYPYEYYAQQLSGQLTENKTDFLKKEQYRYDHLSDEINSLLTQYNDKRITLEDYKVKSMEISDFAKLSLGFHRAKQQYDTLIELQKERGVPLHFISTIPSSYLFMDSNRDLLLGLLYSVLLIVCLCNLFCCEYKNGMITLIRSTKNGRAKLFFIKAFHAYVVAAIFMLLLDIPIYLTMAGRYHFTDWTAPIQSILKYKDFTIDISVIQFILLIWMIQFATAFAMVSTLILLSNLLKKQTLTILIGALTLSVPIIIQYILPKLYLRYSFADGFNMYQRLSEQNAFLYGCFYVAVMIIITVLATVVALRKFCSCNLH